MDEKIDSSRLHNLASRLVASGAKAAHVSASECHEISEGLHSALDEIDNLNHELAEARGAAETYRKLTDVTEKTIELHAHVLNAVTAERDAAKDELNELINATIMGPLKGRSAALTISDWYPVIQAAKAWARLGRNDSDDECVLLGVVRTLLIIEDEYDATD